MTPPPVHRLDERVQYDSLNLVYRRRTILGQSVVPCPICAILTRISSPRVTRSLPHNCQLDTHGWNPRSYGLSIYLIPQGSLHDVGADGRHLNSTH